MEIRFNCPHCGAPVEYQGDQPTMVCPFCNSLVDVPPEVLQKVRETVEVNQARKWSKWVLVGLVLIIVVPTCIGFGGTILGVMAGIFGAIIAILAPFIGTFMGK
jgi:hypothetical protein